MKIIFCDKIWPEKWDEFVKNNSLDFGLLQSWVWGEFQESLGKKIFRLAVVDDEENILAVASVIKNKLRLGKSYFYIPRGPVLRRGEAIFNFQFSIFNECVGLLFKEIKSLAKKEGAIFLRLEPAMEDNEENKKLLLEKDFKFIGQVQPKRTLVLDLKKPEEEILAQMKSKTRYNIKVAQNHKIEIDEGDKYFNDFWRLMEQTSKRDQFVAHPREYYEKMLAVLGEAGVLKLIIAKSEDKIIAANLVIFFGRWGVYLHGASDYEYRNQMAPYLLQWQMILEAEKNGCLFYDFWGVDENKWPGVTRFKNGFVPQNNFTEYVGAWDEIYNKFWYNLYRLVKRRS